MYFFSHFRCTFRKLMLLARKEIPITWQQRSWLFNAIFLSYSILLWVIFLDRGASSTHETHWWWSYEGNWGGNGRYCNLDPRTWRCTEGRNKLWSVDVVYVWMSHTTNSISFSIEKVIKQRMSYYDVWWTWSLKSRRYLMLYIGRSIPLDTCSDSKAFSRCDNRVYEIW